MRVVRWLVGWLDGWSPCEWLPLPIATPVVVRAKYRSTYMCIGEVCDQRKANSGHRSDATIPHLKCFPIRNSPESRTIITYILGRREGRRITLITSLGSERYRLDL